MTEEKYKKLLIVQSLLSQAKTIVQSEGLMGGHRGDLDDNLTIISNDIYYEIEKYENDIKKLDNMIEVDFKCPNCNNVMRTSLRREDVKCVTQPNTSLSSRLRFTCKCGKEHSIQYKLYV